MRKLSLVIIGLLFITSVSALNLEETNVMDVEKNSDRFSVTLYHEDSGEEGYANWWQIETMEGEKISRRTLLHSHGTRNFTRSQNIEIPSDIDQVIIRGHDQTHGYGGRAAIYSLKNGEISFVDQGSNPQNFSENISGNKGNNGEENTVESSSETSSDNFISGLIDWLSGVL